MINIPADKPELLSNPLHKKQEYHLVGDDGSSEEQVVSTLHEIITNHKIINTGMIHGVEGGLTIDYIDLHSNKECRFILGFTELGCWVECNSPK